MNIETITVDPEVAERKLRAYRAQMHRKTNAEYEQISRGYQELARGRDLINLPEVIKAGGFDEKGRPNLAIARADRRQVTFSRNWQWPRGCQFDTRLNNTWSETLLVTIDLPLDVERERGYALVPLTPADVVEELGGRVNLASHFVLWEVEEWADRPLMAEADRDPYLLRPIGGDLYAIMAAWDLTDLERSVMAGRRIS